MYYLIAPVMYITTICYEILRPMKKLQYYLKVQKMIKSDRKVMAVYIGKGRDLQYG